MALSHVVSEIFNVEKYRNLEIPVKSRSNDQVDQGHRNWHGSIRHLWFPINVQL